jgi:hypothetical protein
VPCIDNAAGTDTTGVCTATEALILSLVDIPQGLYDPSTLLPTQGSCYVCLNQAGALDDNGGDSRHECEDFGTAIEDAGPEAGISETQACLNTFACLLGSNCSANANGEPWCYCGDGGIATCNTSATAAQVDGPCIGAEVAGFNGTTAPSAIYGAFVVGSYPSGRANSIVSSAGGNNCFQCFTQP